MQITTQVYMVTVDAPFHHGDKKSFLAEAAKYESAGIATNEWSDEGNNYYIVDSEHKTFPADKARIAELTIAGVPLKVAAPQDLRVDITDALQDMANKSIEVALSNEGGGNTYNNKCEVHMPGQALSLYNDIMLMENACSDALQNELNNGWRIITACPQPDQRRPDYILGRYNPERSPTDLNAERG